MRRALLRRAAVILALTLAALPAAAHQMHDDTVTPAVSASARTLLKAFRKSGDDRYLDQAQALVDARLPGTASVDELIDAALVAQARHYFDAAMELTRNAVARAADSDQAWLLINSIALVQGREETAAAACRRLRHSPLLVILTCHARVAILAGDEAIIRSHLNALVPMHVTDPEVLAWSRGVCGDLAVALGKDSEAIRYYGEALALNESVQVRGALVDALIRSDRLAEAQRVLDAGSRALPLDVRRLIVAHSSGDRSKERIEHMDLQFRAWIADGDWRHAREMARFYLDVKPAPQLAHELAVINIGIQKEPEDRRLLQRASAILGSV